MPDYASLTVELPPGRCMLTATADGLAAVALPARDADVPARDEAAGGPELRRLLAEARRQLQAYFAGELREFDLPLDLSGRTEFQGRVLAACRGIPYGATASYGELARRSGHPGAARAVGQVMAGNRLALVVPCHRVLASDGGLGGYGGGAALKRRLLAMERCQVGWRQAVGGEGDSTTGCGASRVDLGSYLNYNTRGHSRLVRWHCASRAQTESAAAGLAPGRKLPCAPARRL